MVNIAGSRLVLNLKAYAAARQGGDADLAWDTAAPSGALSTSHSDVQFLTELPARSRRSRARVQGRVDEEAARSGEAEEPFDLELYSIERECQQLGTRLR